MAHRAFYFADRLRIQHPRGNWGAPSRMPASVMFVPSKPYPGRPPHAVPRRRRVRTTRYAHTHDQFT